MDKLTVEDLMKPRYEVIADYPGNQRDVGSIIIGLYGNEDQQELERQLSKYPYLFKKLSWWERREVDEMPEYLITIHKDKWIYRVHHHFVEAKNGLGFTTEDGHRKSYCNYLPATEKQYLEYINKKQQ